MVVPTAGQKVCVILGAGASHDVHGVGSHLADGDFQPPLAKDLFNLRDHHQYRDILQDYPGADHLALQLAAPSSERDFNLEGELRVLTRLV